MIRKPTVYKRRFRGFSRLFSLLLLLFLGVFCVLFGTWLLFHSRFYLVSPLPHAKPQTVQSKVAQIQMLCAEKNLSCTHITLAKDGTAHFQINLGGEVTLSLTKDIPTQISSLQLTMAHLTIEGRRFKSLDFRFDKPVISY